MSESKNLSQEIIAAHRRLIELECNDTVHAYPSSYHRNLSKAREEYLRLIREK
jgi:hypothetical protein